MSEFGTPKVTNWPVGRMAHAEDCKSFYIGSIPVPASTIFRLSSAVEQSAVNRLVVGSNPTVGAKTQKSHPQGWLFCVLNSDTDENQREVGSTPSESQTKVWRSPKAMSAKETRSGAIRQSEPIKKTSLWGGFFIATEDEMRTNEKAAADVRLVR